MEFAPAIFFFPIPTLRRVVLSRVGLNLENNAYVIMQSTVFIYAFS